jgi:hypothetical protein
LAAVLAKARWAKFIAKKPRLKPAQKRRPSRLASTVMGMAYFKVLTRFFWRPNLGRLWAAGNKIGGQIFSRRKKRIAKVPSIDDQSQSTNQSIDW